MKKNWLKIVCVVLTVVMAMSLASCSLFGGKSGNANAVATYVRENGKTIEDAANAQLGSSISVKLEARGASLVYKYTLIGIDNLTAQQKNAISDNLDDPVLSDLSYYRVSGVCAVLKLDEAGEPKLLYFNDNCSTIPDRPLEYGAWKLPEVGKVGPATICDGTYQLYSVRHKGQYEALHVRTEYYDDRVDAVYMTPEGYADARANEINVHTRTSNHTSGRGMWSAGCPLVGGGKVTEFWKLIYSTYYTSYDAFELDNFVGVLTIDRMPLRTELYTLYQNPDAVDKFLAKSRAIQPEKYLLKCTDAVNFSEIQRKKVAADTVIMSLPCLNDTDARSREQVPLMEGMKLDVLGSIRNDQGESWYQVAFEGRKGYVQQSCLKELGFFEKLWDAWLG